MSQGMRLGTIGTIENSTIQPWHKAIYKLSHVFERFYKGSNSAEESFGIGLCLSNMIISSQNGTIKADNYNGSARFVIKLYKTIM